MYAAFRKISLLSYNLHNSLKIYEKTTVVLPMDFPHVAHKSYLHCPGVSHEYLFISIAFLFRVNLSMSYKFKFHLPYIYIFIHTSIATPMGVCTAGFNLSIP